MERKVNGKTPHLFYGRFGTLILKYKIMWFKLFCSILYYNFSFFDNVVLIIIIQYYDLVVFFFICNWMVLSSNLVHGKFDIKLGCSSCSLAELIPFLNVKYIVVLKKKYCLIIFNINPINLILNFICIRKCICLYNAMLKNNNDYTYYASLILTHFLPQTTNKIDTIKASIKTHVIFFGLVKYTS